jgi:Protein of unknown function (DUF2505)
MKTVTESFVLPCPPEAVWRLFLDEAYLRALYLEELEFKGLSVLELGEAARKLRIVPRINLPAALEKLVGESFAYEDHATLDRAQGVWTWKMVQPAQARPKKELVSTHGMIRLTATGDGGCQRTDSVSVEAHVFGLGGVIEATVEKEIRASWGKELGLMKRWLARQG